MTRAIPSLAVQLVTKWEGFRPKAYHDGGGVPTIGFGHTSSVTEKDVRLGRRITFDTACELLTKDLQIAAARLEKGAGAKAIAALSENQYAALLTFAYNCGFSPTWMIARCVCDGALTLVPAQMRRFIHDGGDVVQGLVNRREDEIRMWEGAWTC